MGTAERLSNSYFSAVYFNSVYHMERSGQPVSLYRIGVNWTNSPRNIRIVNLICASPCWLLYDVFVRSYGGIVSESITMLSILISILRFGWKGLEKDIETAGRKPHDNR